MSSTGRTQQEQSAAMRAARVQRRAEEAHPLMRLQRQVGNQAVAGMLAQREGEEEELQASRDATLQREGEEEELQASRDTTLQREGEGEELQASRDATLQREGQEEELQASRDMTLQREGEEEELQASRDATLQRAPSLLQRLLAPFTQRAEDDEEALQAKAEVGMEGGPVSDSTAERIQAVRSNGGAPLDAGTRSHMEGAFDTSFDDVRVHTGGEASSVSRQIGALAFTAGTDVFMRDDAYKPGTEEGHRLLSHELTHVVQQRSMPATGDGMHVGPAGDHYEQAADARAAAIAPAVAAAQRESDNR